MVEQSEPGYVTLNGAFKGVGDFIEGNVNLLKNPGKALDSLTYAVTHPGEALDAIQQANRQKLASILMIDNDWERSQAMAAFKVERLANVAQTVLGGVGLIRGVTMIAKDATVAAKHAMNIDLDFPNYPTGFAVATDYATVSVSDVGVVVKATAVGAVKSGGWKNASGGAGAMAMAGHDVERHQGYAMSGSAGTSLDTSGTAIITGQEAIKAQQEYVLMGRVGESIKAEQKSLQFQHEHRSEIEAQYRLRLKASVAHSDEQNAIWQEYENFYTAMELAPERLALFKRAQKLLDSAYGDRAERAFDTIPGSMEYQQILTQLDRSEDAYMARENVLGKQEALSFSTKSTEWEAYKLRRDTDSVYQDLVAEQYKLQDESRLLVDRVADQRDQLDSLAVPVTQADVAKVLHDLHLASEDSISFLEQLSARGSLSRDDFSATTQRKYDEMAIKELKPIIESQRTDNIVRTQHSSTPVHTVPSIDHDAPGR